VNRLKVQREEKWGYIKETYVSSAPVTVSLCNVSDLTMQQMCYDMKGKTVCVHSTIQ